MTDKMTPAQRADFKRLTVNDVMMVYSGKNGCCCGCRGYYRCALDKLAIAVGEGHSFERDEHVNGEFVRKVVTTMRLRDDEVTCFGNGFSLQVTSDRQYKLYPVPGFMTEEE